MVRFIGAETNTAPGAPSFEESRLSFKLISFLALPRLMLRPPSNQSLFWIFWGFVTLTQPDAFPDFFQARLQLFMSSFWFLLHMSQNFASSFGFYCTCVYLHLLPLGLYCAYA